MEFMRKTMRLMMHINIGASIALLAWLAMQLLSQGGL